MHSPLLNGHLPSTCAIPEHLWGWAGLSAASLPVTVCGNPRVVGSPVRQFSVAFDPLDVRDATAQWNGLAALPELADATPTRRFEFLAGRVCAAEAMRRLGVPTEALLRRRPDGTPVWPAGLTGSITHTIGFVSVAVASTDRIGALGIDSEEILSAERAQRVANVFATAAEVASARAAGLDEQTAVSLIFSAKEAIFKCLHASVHRIFDFDDVQITHVNAANRRFTAEVQHSLSTAFPAGSALVGSFDIDVRRVHTGMVVAPQVRE